MGKLLGTLLLSIVLIGTASAAFADEDMNINPAPAYSGSGPYVVDNQTTPYAPNVESQ